MPGPGCVSAPPLTIGGAPRYFALFNDNQGARRNRVGGRFGRYSFQPSSRCPARNTIIYKSLEGVHNLNEDLFSHPPYCAVR